MPLVGPEAFRQTCGAFTTGVAIVSVTTADGAPCGLTVNSFTAVSLSPPLVLWTLRRNSRALPVFDSARACSISILAEDQGDVARSFSSADERPFERVAHRPGDLGAPVIDGCVAYLEARPYQRFEAGDHIIYVCLVEQAHRTANRPPLAFQGGGYGRFAPGGRPEPTVRRAS